MRACGAGGHPTCGRVESPLVAGEPTRSAYELFQAALERDPDQQKAFLDEACGEDGFLRAKVESLLAADRDAAGFVDPAGGPETQTAGAAEWRAKLEEFQAATQPTTQPAAGN